MLGFGCVLVLAIRIIELAWQQLRLVNAMSQPGHKQNFWKLRQWSWMPGLKRRVLYAPLWKKRHNREIRLSAAVNMGTLPSRLHALLLFVYLGSNIAYMFLLDWSKENKFSLLAEVRGRAGTLALVNMVPLIILAARNNPLIPMLQISFDTYNLYHRWLGRVVVAEVIIHTVAWAIVQVADNGWEGVWHRISDEAFISAGAVGTLAMCFIFVLSFSPLRHAFYETFLNTHIILAVVVIACTWVHCASAELIGGLPQLPWTYAIAVLWALERGARVLRTVVLNWTRSRGFSHALVEALPAEACRVTIHLARHVDIKPGQHAYLRFGSVNPWESHPFSIAWHQHVYRDDDTLPSYTEKVYYSSSDSSRSANSGSNMTATKPSSTRVSFIIGAHTGMTRKLYDKARGAPNGRLTMRAALEGPYAGHHSLDSYGHVVLFAGGPGITHQLSYVRHLLAGVDEGTVATRRVSLVWVIRDSECLTWVRPMMEEILGMRQRKEVLRIALFVTRPRSANDVASHSRTVEMHPGRPNIPLLLERAVEEQMGAMSVSVCGPGGLADDVRHAVRQMLDRGTVIDFHEEAFTW